MATTGDGGLEGGIGEYGSPRTGMDKIKVYENSGEVADLWRLLLQIHGLTLRDESSITGNTYASICTCIRVLIEAAVAEARERDGLKP
jgi:hypothetical protein